MDVGVGDVLPLLVVAAFVAPTRLLLRRRPLSPGLAMARARGRGAEGARRRWHGIPGVKIDPLIDVVLVALGLVYVGFLASFLIETT